MKIIERLKNPGHAMAGLLRRLWFLFPNDKFYVSLIYRLESGKRLELDNPQLFTEKIQWLKLYDHNADYVSMVDKIQAKKFVSERIGEQYVTPTLGIWNHFDEIDFGKLPDKFVLKTNHGGGGNAVVLCKDKSKFDKFVAKRVLERSLHRNGYWAYREWPYKKIVPKIFAEQLIESSEKDEKSADIVDYKFFCFDGEPKYCQVIQNRHIKETIDFFDMEWNHQVFVGLIPGVKNATVVPARPKHFEEMKLVAKKLSERMPFVRIDLYDTDENIYFGEITFYPASGLGTFYPSEYDLELGNMIQLPKM